MCSWNEDAILPEDLYKFPPDAMTTGAVDKIMKYTGLEVNFDLVAANVPNAVATMEGNKRLILYNQLFMRDISKQAKTDWAAISILAHEIGHHLQQHTLGAGGMKSEQELAADKFSGDILYKMGATIDEAKAAMESRPETKSPNYPKKSVRLIAIGNGWIGAEELAKSRPGNQGAPAANSTPGDSARTVDAQAERDRQAALDRKAAQEERDRKAADEERARKAAADEEKEKKAEEKESRRAEREAKAQERLLNSRGCYDAYLVRRCNLQPGLAIGASCFCYGLVGFGIIGNP